MVVIASFELILNDHDIAGAVFGDQINIKVPGAALTEGENTVALPVTDDWGAGAYVTATVIRPMDAPSGQAPARALGLAHAGIDPGARALDVSLITGETSAPRGPLRAQVQVDGIAEDLILPLDGFRQP